MRNRIDDTVLVVTGVALFAAALGLFGYAQLHPSKHPAKIETHCLQASPTPSGDDDLKYWTEHLHSPDGVCRCPGGYQCEACKNDDSKQCDCGKGCACAPNRLDYLEAQRKYEAVKQMFGPVLDSLGSTP